MCTKRYQLHYNIYEKTKKKDLPKNEVLTKKKEKPYELSITFFHKTNVT